MIASDPDSGQAISYFATNLPDGLSIDSLGGNISGVIVDTSFQIYHVEALIRDDWNNLLTDAAFFDWTVDGVNLAPVIDSVPDQFNYEGNPISLVLPVTEQNAGQILTYQPSGLPNGLFVTPSGVISGTITTGAMGNYNVQIIVSDDGSPVLSDTVNFAWTVDSADCSTFTGSGSVIADETCGDANGSAVAVASGGIAPYTFLWNSASGSQVNDTAFALAAGTHYLIGTDVQSCQFIDTVVIVDTICPPNGNILLVSSSVSQVNDNIIKDYLDSLGYNVRIKNHESATISDTADNELIIISNTVAPGKVESKFRDLFVPVIVTEQNLYDEMGMTASGGGKSNDVTTITVYDSLHPITSGYSGAVTIYDNPEDAAFGNPSSQASILARVGAPTSGATIFTYEAGDSMVGMTAPGRRVGFFMTPNSPSEMNADGWALLVNAVCWAIGDCGILNEDPNAVATADTSGGIVPFDVQFDGSASSDSDGSIVSYHWDFGDGNTDSTVNPVHTFQTEGTFPVVLTVTDDAGGMDTDILLVEADTIISMIPPVAVIDAMPDSGELPLPVSFDGSNSYDTDGSVVGYNWDFGDGNLGSGISTSHTYLVPGTYTVYLQVVDNIGLTALDSAIIQVDSSSVPLAPIASISGSPLSGMVPLTVNLDGQASYDLDGNIITYSWDLGDGSNASGDSISYTFTTDGTYQVVLTVTDDDSLTGTDTLTIQADPVPPPEPPVAVAQASPDSGIVPLSVSFDASGSTDPDSNIVSYFWDFGDSTSGSGLMPVHIYQDTGSFTAVLTVLDADSLSDTDSVLIVVSPVPPPEAPVAAFVATPDSGSVPLNVSLDASTSSDSDGSISSYLWDFGDGNTASGVSQTHIYTDTGSYQLQLIVIDNDSLSDTTSQTITVVLPAEQQVLMVVADSSNLNGSDTEAKNLLEAQGLTVILASDDLVQTSDANGKSMIYLSASASAGQVGTKFTNVTVPVMTSQRLLYQEMGLAAADGGKLFGQNTIHIVDDSHPMAAGYSGSNQVSSSNLKFNTGIPNANAIVISVHNNDSSRATIFGYEDGAVMPGLTAPARRTTFFVDATSSINSLNTDGKALFDAVVCWTIGNCGAPPAPNVPPVALAQADTTNGPAPLDVQFTGSGSTDSDGSIVSYYWNFGDGDTSVVSDPMHTYSTPGTYSAVLTVTDDDGATDTDSLSIQVDTANVALPPVAVIQATPDSGIVSLLVSFDGSGSFDPNNNISSYFWEFGDGNVDSVISPVHTYTQVGTYTAKLTVIDTDSLIGIDSVVIQVDSAPPPQPPVAVIAANPTSGFASLVVDFDASGSSDPDGVINSYSWNFGDGNSGSGQTIQHTFNSVGTFEVILTVLDNDSLSATDTISIQVDSLPSVQEVLMVVANAGSLNGSDTEVKNLLEAQGLTVILASDELVQTSDASGKVMVYLSASASAGQVGTKFTNVAVPVMTSQRLLYQEMGISATDGTKLFGQNTIFIVDDSHPMAAGYSTSVQVSSSNLKFNTGVPNANAIVISVHSNDSSRSTIFGYESGAVMPGLTAPARRTAFFVDAASSVGSLNTDGQALFDAVVCWTIGTCGGTPPANQPPVAVAQADTTNGPVLLDVQFTGSGSSDSDGSIVSYYWNFGDGDTSVVSDPMHTFIAPGTYDVVLTVTDDDGATDADSLSIQVDTANTAFPPVAVIQATPDSGIVSLQVSFDGSASFDPNNNISSYFWEFGDGNVDSVIAPTHIYTQVGTYTAKLTVIDTDSLIGIDSVVIQVDSVPPPQPPVAVIAANPTSGYASLVVDFDASGSSDPDGTISSYSWDFGDGNSGSGQTIQHTFDSVGTFEVILTVLDNDSLSATDTISIQVDSLPSVQEVLMVVANAASLNGSDTEVKNLLEAQGLTVVLASDELVQTSDATGKSMVYLSATASAGQVGTKFTNVAVPVMTSQRLLYQEMGLAASDGGKLFGQNSIHIVDDSHPMAAGYSGSNQVSSSNLKFNTGIPNANAIVISVHSNDSSRATIFGYESGAAMPGLTAPARRTTFFVDASSSINSLNADGKALFDAVVCWTLGTCGGAPAPQPPVAVAQADTTSGYVPLTVQFNGSSSTDADGSIVSYYWEFGDGNVDSTISPSHTYTQIGTYVAKLTVTDSDTLTGIDSLVIQVDSVPPPQPPIAVAQANPTLGVAPLTVNFDGSGSSDPDGSISVYAWDFGDGNVDSTISPSHTYTQIGTYTAKLTVIDTDSLMAMDSVVIQVDSVLPPQPPVAAMSATPMSGTVPLLVDFDASASFDMDGTITAYYWDFGDGNTGTGQTTQHTYTTVGTFEAVVMVLDNDGLNDFDTLYIQVDSVAASQDILMVVANAGNLNGSDTEVKNLLEGLGYTVIPASDELVQTSDATGKAMVYLSGTANAGQVGTKFTNVAVPVMTSQRLLYQEMGACCI